MYDLVDEIATTYLNNVRIKSEFVAASCPFHKGGQERHPSFWISRSEGKWGCWSCDAGGGDLESLMLELGEAPAHIKDALAEARKEAKKQAPLRRAKRMKKAQQEFKGVYLLPETLLGVYDFVPEGLVEAGFDPDLLSEYYIGYDKRLGRITFPVWDVFGNLVGISGRQPDGKVPKYKFYEGWHKDYNGNRVPGELGESFPSYSSDGIRDHLWLMNTIYDDLMRGVHDELIVVEGYKACLWLRQLGWRYTVAIMGSSMSLQQMRLIIRTGAKVLMLLDANEAGRKGSAKACSQLASRGVETYECHYKGYPDTTQPDDLEDEPLENILVMSTRVGGRNVRLAPFKKSRQALPPRQPVRRKG